MPGWIKLWRQLADNGHFKMPDLAFKLWIYCLLKASPFPADGLAPGELYISYSEIQRELGRPGTKMSRSTISRALRYLEEHGYLSLEAAAFKGIRARVVNWDRYQCAAGTESVPAEPAASTESVLEKKPGAARLSASSSTESVLGLVLSEYQTSTLRVLGKGPEPRNGAASGAPKNNNKNIDLGVGVYEQIQKLFEAEFGRSLSPIEVDQLNDWLAVYGPEAVRGALIAASLNGRRTLAYVGGILRRQAGVTAPERAARAESGRRQGRAGRPEAISDWGQDEEEKRRLLRSLYLS